MNTWLHINSTSGVTLEAMRVPGGWLTRQSYVPPQPDPHPYSSKPLLRVYFGSIFIPDPNNEWGEALAAEAAVKRDVGAKRSAQPVRYNEVLEAIFGESQQ